MNEFDESRNNPRQLCRVCGGRRKCICMEKNLKLSNTTKLTTQGDSNLPLLNRKVQVQELSADINGGVKGLRDFSNNSRQSFATNSDITAALMAPATGGNKQVANSMINDRRAVEMTPMGNNLKLNKFLDT
jgi:hypothetical protein